MIVPTQKVTYIQCEFEMSANEIVPELIVCQNIEALTVFFKFLYTNTFFFLLSSASEYILVSAVFV